MRIRFSVVFGASRIFYGSFIARPWRTAQCVTADASTDYPHTLRLDCRIVEIHVRTKHVGTTSDSGCTMRPFTIGLSARDAHCSEAHQRHNETQKTPIPCQVVRHLSPRQYARPVGRHNSQVH